MGGSPHLTKTLDASSLPPAAKRAATMNANPRSTIEPPAQKTRDSAASARQVLHDLTEGRVEPLVVHDTLGEGGMGVVLRATQQSLGRDVAMKTLREGHYDPVAATRLLREAWVTGSLEHPNIVPVYDVAVEKDGRPRVLLKRIEGVHWGALLADPKALAQVADTDPEEWNLRTLMQVCNAIHFAHSRGVLHRDIKPENIMIGRFGEVYVVDWGIAVSLRNEPGSRLPLASEATEIAGTPAYIAPEMLLGEPARLGPATDVYLLGAVLFELVTGRAPHDGTDMVAIFASSLTSPPEIPPKVPREIADILRRAMARETADRYESVDAFRRALGDYLQHRQSMRLSRRAQHKLNELVDELRSGAADTTIYPLYGECAFGFRAALDAWPDNQAAKGGLRVAGETMLKRELDAGNLDAARRIITELPNTPEDLVRRLDELEAVRQKDLARRASLEALELDRDPARGSRTRTFVSLLMGSLWILLPVFMHFFLRATGRALSVQISLFVALGSLVLLLGLGYWARESLRATALNRGAFWLVALTLVAQAFLDGLLFRAGVPFTLGAQLACFLWFVSAALGSALLEPRMWPVAVGYGVAAIVMKSFPDHLLLVMAAAQVVLVVDIGIIWGRAAFRS